MTLRSALQALRGGWRMALVPVVVVAFIALLGAVFFLRGQSMMQEQLRSQLRDIAGVAALQFDGTYIRQVRSREDVHSEAYPQLVKKLRYIRDAVPHVRFAYIMRRTADPLILEFVADADGLATVEELDFNGNGFIDEDEQQSLPGDPYDISGLPAMQDEAWSRPVADEEIYVDQWGALISGYAPIRNPRGEVIAILGIDMDAGAYINLSRSIFSPVALLLVVIGGTGIGGYISYMFIRRRRDAQRQVDAARAALLELASHQLGQPLATFKWWLEILRERDNGKFCQECEACDELQAGIDRMDEIIRSMNEAMYFSGGTIRYNPAPDSLARIVRKVKAARAKQLEYKRQRLKLMIERDVPDVLIDSAQIEGVVTELIENASAYSGADTTITVRVYAKGRKVRLEVADDGCGIPADEQEHVFERFVRGSKAHLKKPVGNGLGLYIAKSIIERAEGDIWMKSAPDKGTTVYVELPAVKPRGTGA